MEPKKLKKDYTKEAIIELAKEARIEDNKRGNYDNKPEITLPYKGKLVSEFAEEISEIIRNKEKLFYRRDSRDIVEIGRVKLEDGTEEYLGFLSVKPNRFITLIEKHLTPGLFEKEKNKINGEIDWIFKPKSITGDVGKTILVSQILEDALPKVDRIFTIPIPIIHQGKLSFPKRGYDKRFKSWTPHDAPEIINLKMNLEEAKEIIYNIFKEFCFKSHQDYINAIAGLLSPFLRGLYPSFNTRAPVFIHLANRERAGKDYEAGITGIVYEDHALEEPPICSGEKNSSNNEELRKKIMAALIAGRKRLHFANNKGFINNAVFEGIITAKKYSDRVLGKNEILTFDNEMDFSLSGNIGIRFTPDLINRSRFIRLFLDIEDANKRSFDNPNLHKWVSENRGLVISALYSLVRNWFDKGMTPGKLNFASFPEWADICGGIMESAGYDSPCNPDKETLNISVDKETQDIKKLFELCYEKHPDKWIKKREIVDIIIDEAGEIFGYLDFKERSSSTKFGLMIKKFIGRVFSDVRLMVQDTSIRSSRWVYKFTREEIFINKSNIFGRIDGKDGKDGNNKVSVYIKQKSNIIYREGTNDAKATKDTTFSAELIKESGLDPELVKNTIKEIDVERNLIKNSKDD